MKTILKRIHAQPDHIREIIAGSCTVVVALVIIGFWAHSFESTGYALLNPGQEDATQTQTFAVSTGSLFGQIGSAFGDLKAEISGLFSGNQAQTTTASAQPAGEVHPLPASQDK